MVLEQKGISDHSNSGADLKSKGPLEDSTEAKERSTSNTFSFVGFSIGIIKENISLET